jgi:3-oxoacyl-[acyl-carrier protein] reductase
VNISCAAFRASRSRIQAYCASKPAVRGLTRQLAMELGRFGVTVNTVAPGLVLTDADKQASWDAMGGERRGIALGAIALGRPGPAKDIADATLFLAAGPAGLISGPMLPVNGDSF